MAGSYINTLHSFFSYGVSRYTGIPLRPPLPPAISVELTNICNLSCPECATGAGLLNRRKGMIDINLAGKIAEELSGTVLSSYLYFQGEPMLHPQFFEIVRLFRKMNPVISTNGHFLNAENCTRLASSGLKKIIISFDGISADTYIKYRQGGDHDKVKEGILELVKAVRKSRSEPTVEIQFLIGKHNEQDLGAVMRFAKSMGTSFKIKSMQVLDNSRANEWITKDLRRSRFRIDDGKIIPMHTPRSGCFRMWSAAVITIDGDVVPCCYDKNAEFSMGNMNSHTFTEIWNGTEYNSFRTIVMHSREEIAICKACPQGRRLTFRT